MHRMKRDCYADTKNIFDSENWQLQIGNGLSTFRAVERRSVSSRGFSCRYRLLCDLRLGLRDNFARVSRRVFLETRTNRVSPIMRVREIGIAHLHCRSLARSIWAQREFSNYSGALPFRSAAAKTPRNSLESCKQASTLYLPSRSLERGEEVGNRYYRETCSDIIRDFTSRSFLYLLFFFNRVSI